MKITAKILFGALLMGGLLSACHPSSPNKGGSTPSGADSAYISFSLDCPQGILREGGEILSVRFVVLPFTSSMGIVPRAK